MKIWKVFYFLTALSAAAFAQEAEPIKPGSALQQTIERFVIGGFFEGRGIKEMRRAGDSTAVVLTRVLSDHELNKTQIESSIYILNAAFSEPSLIDNASDREPRTALFILRYLDLCTQDSALKAQIVEARKHITEQAAKGTKPGS